MEQTSRSSAPLALGKAEAMRPAVAPSFVDSLFDMPKGTTKKRASAGEKAESARLEARLASEMRKLIAERLKGNAG